MESQGYLIENNVLYQDKKSTIILAKNDRNPAGKSSKHIKKANTYALDGSTLTHK